MGGPGAAADAVLRVRGPGGAPSTVTHRDRAAGEFLARIGYETQPTRPAALDREDLDAFLCAVGRRQSRAALRHLVGHLRALIRFPASSGEIPTGLDARIGTPRVYRGEQLPRALPWGGARFGRCRARSIARPRWGVANYSVFLLMVSAADDRRHRWRGAPMFLPAGREGRPRCWMISPWFR